MRILVAGPEPDPPLRALLELKAGLGDAELLGPAPVLRLRGRWRAQLVAKTDAPRALAGRAGRLLVRRGPGDAPRGAHGGRRRRPAEPLRERGYTRRVANEAGQIRQEELDGEREARRRNALAQVRQYGDPVLRMRAREVDQFDDDLVRLAERMTRLMQEANGVGLAANQVGVLQRLVVIQPGADEEPAALVNPELVEKGDAVETDDEGCLSLQGVLVPVERPSRVVVAAKDPQGGDVRLELDELAARVVQHELDHLDGVLILDRTADEARREALSILRPRIVLTSGSEPLSPSLGPR